MTFLLPVRADLAHLRDDARSLQRACREGDARAVHRLAVVLPSEQASLLPLSKAQTVIAREYGFVSWARLKAEVEARFAARVARAAKKDAKSKRAGARLALIDKLAIEITGLAVQGDPLEMVNRKPYGRTIDILVRERISADAMIWAKVVDVFIAGLKHPKPRVRYECAHALDTYDDGRAAAALTPLLDDPVPRVRWMAMHALVCDTCKVEPAQWGQDICLRIAEHAISDPSVKVRRRAAWEVTRCGAVLAAETLKAILDQESDKVVRNITSRALLQLEKRE